MKNPGQDFLGKLDDLIHNHIDEQLRHLTIVEFKIQKEQWEEDFAEWLWDKFIKDVGHV